MFLTSSFAVLKLIAAAIKDKAIPGIVKRRTFLLPRTSIEWMAGKQNKKFNRPKIKLYSMALEI